MARPYIPELDFSSAPTVSAFMQSQALARFIIGPIGSGKTTGCVVDPMAHALQQAPAPSDFVRYFKVLIVRNTGPELRMTTIPSYQEIFRPESCGPVVFSAPMRHYIRREPSHDHNTHEDIPGLDYKAEFIGLDKPADIKRLLSYEGTMIYLNEVREIPQVIIERAIERAGRYPSKDRGEPSFLGLIADTNPFDEDHFLCEWEKTPPAGYAFFRQPPAVLEVEERDGDWHSKEPGYPYIERDPDMIHRSKEGKLYVTNPHAENLDNLTVAEQLDPLMRRRGPGGYYGRNIAGKATDAIRVYYQGRNGYVREGVAVVPEYDDEIMAVRDLPILKDRPLEFGIDVGGGTLNPSAVIGQRHPLGTWLIHAEVICPDMGLKRFAEMLKRALAAPRFKGLRISNGYGDPAGERRDELFETKIFTHLANMQGIMVVGAPSNDPKLRQQAYKDAIGRYTEGKPGLLINRDECPQLRAALRGKWHFKVHHQTQKASDLINKNHPWSDVADAGGYMMLGGGEYVALDTPNGAASVAAYEAMMNNGGPADWDVFN